MPAFSLADFLAASLDWLTAHPLGYALLVAAGALVVWTCGVGLTRAASSRRQARVPAVALVQAFPDSKLYARRLLLVKGQREAAPARPPAGVPHR